MFESVTLVRDLEVPIPRRLARLGERPTARLFGSAGPLVVAMGGISADRSVCDSPAARGWWTGLAEPGAALDPTRMRILGLDFAADETGATAPSTAEQAEVLAAALDALGVAAADVIVGASYGGMVALAFAEAFPDRVRRLALVCAPASPHPASTASRELQRRVVAMGLTLGSGAEALSIARGMAMLTYRTPEEFAARFAGGTQDPSSLCVSAPGAYLRARGDTYGEVMTPERFLSLSASIDRHRVDPARVPHRTLVIGAESDRLVPPDQLRALAAALPQGSLHLIDSLYGHDMFLKEAAALGRSIAPLLEGL